MPFYLLFPLVAAIVYALGSIVIKRALGLGVTMDQSFHITNLFVGLVFLPLLFFEQKEIDWTLVWKPMVMGAVFFLGNWLTFLGIKRGDVSLVTPIMGTKVVWVAIGLVLLTGQIPSRALWIAALLTAMGIFVMGLGDLKSGSHLVLTVSLTLSSAALFGICDVLVNWWSASFGAPTFLSIGSMTVALFSIGMLAFRGKPSLVLAVSLRKWAWWGGFLIGIQAIAMGMSLSHFPDATGINVVYASRGLWVIVLVVVLGPILGNSEHRESGRAFWWRVLGTVILTTAIVIAVVDRTNHE